MSPKWEQQLTVNRSEYNELAASLSLPLSLDFCKAVVRMEHAVGCVVVVYCCCLLFAHFILNFFPFFPFFLLFIVFF